MDRRGFLKALGAIAALPGVTIVAKPEAAVAAAPAPPPAPARVVVAMGEWLPFAMRGPDGTVIEFEALVTVLQLSAPKLEQLDVTYLSGERGLIGGARDPGEVEMHLRIRGEVAISTEGR